MSQITQVPLLDGIRRHVGLGHNRFFTRGLCTAGVSHRVLFVLHVALNEAGGVPHHFRGVALLWHQISSFLSQIFFNVSFFEDTQVCPHIRPGILQGQNKTGFDKLDFFFPSAVYYSVNTGGKFLIGQYSVLDSDQCWQLQINRGGKTTHICHLRSIDT